VELAGSAASARAARAAGSAGSAGSAGTARATGARGAEGGTPAGLAGMAGGAAGPAADDAERRADPVGFSADETLAAWLQVPSGTEGPVLECRGLGKTFGGLKAVNGLTFSVMPGEIHGLIGPNGAGKSTAINLISGLDRPTEGEVRFLGRRLAGDMDTRARQGLVRTFQRGRLFMSMTVFENIQAAVGPHNPG